MIQSHTSLCGLCGFMIHDSPYHYSCVCGNMNNAVPFNAKYNTENKKDHTQSLQNAWQGNPASSHWMVVEPVGPRLSAIFPLIHSRILILQEDSDSCVSYLKFWICEAT